MRGSDRDHDAGLANLQTTSAMHDPELRNLKFLVRLLTQTPHLAQRHGRVGFIGQIKRAPPARPFTRVAVERHSRATLGQDDSAGHPTHAHWSRGYSEERLLR